jgi:hypothetical protein
VYFDFNTNLWRFCYAPPPSKTASRISYHPAVTYIFQNRRKGVALTQEPREAKSGPAGEGPRAPGQRGTVARFPPPWEIMGGSPRINRIAVLRGPASAIFAEKSPPALRTGTAGPHLPQSRAKPLPCRPLHSVSWDFIGYFNSATGGDRMGRVSKTVTRARLA